MTKNELIEFLKSNLNIDVELDTECLYKNYKEPWKSTDNRLKIKIKMDIDGEVIGQCEDCIEVSKLEDRKLLKL